MRKEILSIPTEPLKCRHNVNDTEKTCGAPADFIIEGQVDIMGKMVTVKLAVCKECFEELKEKQPRYSIARNLV